jgi:hypothetical protein
MDLDLIFQMIDTAWATILFGLVVMVSFGLVILMALFFLLALRGFLHWLASSTINYVIVSVERKALRER